jgi:hypothetical protein
MPKRYRRVVSEGDDNAPESSRKREETSTVSCVSDEGAVPVDPASAAAARGYDPEIVARDAMSKDPGLSSGLATRLAREAGEILAAEPDADAPDIARRLFAGSPETGATPANCVATAAVAHAREIE